MVCVWQLSDRPWIYWWYYSYATLANLIYSSYLLYRTCGQLESALYGIKLKLEGLSNVKGKLPLFILRFKLKRCLKELNNQMATHSQLNEFWKIVITSTMVSLVTVVSVCMATSLIKDMSLWIKLITNFGALIVFTAVSMMALMVAHVNSKYRTIYIKLAKLCVSKNIGYSLKMKLCYACNRYRRPIGFTQADGSAIDYMSYHEVRKKNITMSTHEVYCYSSS